MTASMSEALTSCLAGQIDVPEDMFEMLTAMAVAEDCSAASEWMLRHKKLPLAAAEKLIARRGVSAAELAAFAARDDMPAETLLAWVRKERRVTVLAQIAAKPNLPREVFETLAARKGTRIHAALLLNETVPADVQADIGAALIGAGNFMPYWESDALGTALDSSELLQSAVFDRLDLNLGVMVDQRFFLTDWNGLSVPQLHRLLDAVERLAAATVDSLRSGGLHQARVATSWLTEHSTADEALLDRLETFAADNPACCYTDLNEAVAVARQRLALFGGFRGSLQSASYSKLVELAVSGALCTFPSARNASKNPLFDTDIAVRVIKTGHRLGRRDPDVDWMLRDWAPDLVSVVRVEQAVLRVEHAMYPQTAMTGLLGDVADLSEHVRTASTDELVAALDSVSDDPAWGLRLAQAIADDAAVDAVTDEVVGRFGWFHDHVAASGTNSRVGALTVDFLYRRFGAHYPTWRMFGSIADSSTSLAEAADLAVHAEPSPNLPS